MDLHNILGMVFLYPKEQFWRVPRVFFKIFENKGLPRPQSPMGNQAGIEKLAIGTRTDSNGVDQDMINGTTAQIYGAGIPPNKTTATTKAMPISY